MAMPAAKMLQQPVQHSILVADIWRGSPRPGPNGRIVTSPELQRRNPPAWGMRQRLQNKRKHIGISSQCPINGVSDTFYNSTWSNIINLSTGSTSLVWRRDPFGRKLHKDNIIKDLRRSILRCRGKAQDCLPAMAIGRALRPSPLTVEVFNNLMNPNSNLGKKSTWIDALTKQDCTRQP
jgi:hypothetical protein